MRKKILALTLSVMMAAGVIPMTGHCLSLIASNSLMY